MKDIIIFASNVYAEVGWMWRWAEWLRYVMEHKGM
ncbi:hypothetical protein KS4_16410 [Poriferisphaera corsica]|uniref:Uncharacterized protein n=1 Tax=Poriferisphaera corsica TaxID=2528020 RepID=A0A517YTM5_9BACT|nr:hypothetical protein KS4_16410 [Poriferisphaera corsica]